MIILYLLFNAGLFEGQQHRLTVLRTQSIDATRIDGSHQIFVHLVLWILVLVGIDEAQSNITYIHLSFIEC